MPVEMIGEKHFLESGKLKTSFSRDKFRETNEAFTGSSWLSYLWETICIKPQPHKGYKGDC